jgi:hypothetical protein
VNFDPLAFVIGLIPEVIKYAVGAYALILITRAVAARIAGPNAPLVLNMPLIALPHWQSLGTKSEFDKETDNTTTLENTEEHLKEHWETPQETLPAVEVMAAGGLVPSPIITKMDREEREELLRVRHEAIALLQRCVEYYQVKHEDKKSGEMVKITDNGTIPRYDELGMSSDNRGKICHNLEESGLVSIVKNHSTFVVPEIGTCAALMSLLIRNQKRVYPAGYSQRRQKLLDSAVAALPEAQHE